MFTLQLHFIYLLVFKRKGKATNSKKKTLSSWEWEEQRDVLIQTLGQLMQLDVNRLWDPPIIEEEFVKYGWRNLFRSSSTALEADLFLSLTHHC